MLFRVNILLFCSHLTLIEILLQWCHLRLFVRFCVLTFFLFISSKWFLVLSRIWYFSFFKIKYSLRCNLKLKTEYFSLLNKCSLLRNLKLNLFFLATALRYAPYIFCWCVRTDVQREKERIYAITGTMPFFFVLLFL